MSSRGMDYMRKIKEKITQALYLDTHSKHVAKLVKQWLSMQDFDVLTWPPQSHDLNPMEHVWTPVKQKLNEYPTPTT